MPGVTFILLIGLFGLATVGAVIVARAAGNRVGWLLLGIGLAIGAAAALAEFGRLIGATDPGTAAIVLLVSGGFWKAWLVQLPLLFLLFPTGPLPSRRWRVVPVALLTLAGITVLGDLVRPVDAATGAGPDNPWAVRPWPHCSASAALRAFCSSDCSWWPPPDLCSCDSDAPTA